MVASDELCWTWASSWYSQGSPRSMQRLHCGEVLSHFLLERVHCTHAFRLRMRLRTAGGFADSMSGFVVACGFWVMQDASEMS